MKRSTKIVLTAAVLGGVAAAGAGVAIAGAVDDDASEVPITGFALERASNAALDFTAGGRVTGTEVGDEESYYEVEVTRSDGSQIDVQLDESFNVVSSEGDRDTRED